MVRSVVVAAMVALLCVGCGGGSKKKSRATDPADNPAAGAETSLDAQLRTVLTSKTIAPLRRPPTASVAKIKLGQALFFDKELSGNRDIACATCHHPSYHTGDHLAVSFGTGGRGAGPTRALGTGRELIPRNSPELFTRGLVEWSVLFWDGRVSGTPATGFTTPAKAQLPQGVESVLAAQAFFPVTSVDEMRGRSGDLDVRGQPNEIAVIPGTDFAAIWQAVMARVLAIPAYQQMFLDAYPGLALAQMSYVQAANAIAAFESSRGATLNSPWDQFVNGNRAALSDEQKSGALLFFGKAKCAECHTGALFTDQKFHNIAVPQLGAGKGASKPYDYGRELETNLASDRYAFRTPPLRNVTMTGPWMHNGAYATLEGAVRHHLNPADALRYYDKSQLTAVMQGTLRNDPATDIPAILSTLDTLSKDPVVLNELEVAQIMRFLDALADPAAMDLNGDIPASVPSGLPIAD